MASVLGRVETTQGSCDRVFLEVLEEETVATRSDRTGVVVGRLSRTASSQ